LYESGEKDGEEALLWAKRPLFLTNNLFSVFLYLREKKKELQQAVAEGKSSDSSSAAANVRYLLPFILNVFPRFLFFSFPFLFSIFLFKSVFAYLR
jgi:hypothetical protein